ncbi:DUF1365 domain-containing protein [Actibacterium sp. XHP0104]|uniref:DUF1365 domain-containing protein n=1 Tax=Actibacterium sp. XHP0104 TaxID=2984335 RepID=UPI0021E95159|nr:DUF1365 domain-containing protein [Actibacterium sp. XHP0104]MCV2882775.1 DUF1365 domain-containing protein [Actibacterium sp. XHP0104]
MTRPEHIAGHTVHSRLGAIANSFRYGVDYVLIDPDAPTGPALFSRNRFNLTAVHDRHHGGPRDKGRGAAWAHEVLSRAGLSSDYDLRLLTQPSILGYIFNPVSFWLAMRDDALIAVIAEVNNTFGDRHSYLCHKPDFAPLTYDDRVEAEKVFHVSPFQQVSGTYAFNFGLTPDHIRIRIAHKNGPHGVIATLSGPRRPLTNRSILSALARRPAGAARTIFLIYWQAFRLRIKGATYRTRPAPPSEEVS